VGGGSSSPRSAWLVEASYLLKVSRPGFWLTSVWFYLLPLGRVRLLDSWTFWLGIVYVSFGLGFIIYGWNDTVDAETDRLNPRKDSFLFGARGTPAQLARLPRQIAVSQLPFAAIFLWLEGPKILVWFAALATAAFLYNQWPRPGLKGRPPFELLNQAGYLLVFVLSSWLNHVPPLPWQTFAFGLLFAMHSHLLGEIMDVEPDRAAGRATTAVRIGVRAAKCAVAGMLLVESALVEIAFRNHLIGGALAAGAIWFLLDAAMLWRDRPYPTAYMRLILLGWNGVAVVSMVWIWSTAALSVVR
jgi:4-hydroxybenzoate polyprenyltransferase